MNDRAARSAKQARVTRVVVAAGASGDDFGAIPIPASYVGAHLRAEDADTIGKLRAQVVHGSMMPR